MIESANNNKIKEIIKLKDKKYQNIENKFLIEGKHLIEEAIKHGYLEEMFVLDGYTYNYDNITYVSENVMRKISDLKTIPNMVGVARKISNGQIRGKVLLLDDIHDPGNMGTIIRSSIAFGIDTLVISNNSVNIYNPKVLRATEGMIFNANIIIDDTSNIIKLLKDDNYTIYITDVTGGNELKKVDFEDKCAIVIGSEASGVNEKIKELADKRLYIKMSDKCESLNAGIATSIILYELSNK